jgi:NNP family nitrate/nitrite transporter-like MFS transporter
MPWPFITKEDPVSPRLHWVFTSMVGVTIMMVAFTFAGLTGNPAISVAVLAVLGFVISWGTGSNFAITPVLFRRCPGVATGFIGGICTIGGIIYPLIYGKVPNIHMGYAVVALTMFVPFTIFFAIVFRRGWRLADVDKGIGTCQGFGVQPIIVTTRKEAF